METGGAQGRTLFFLKMEYNKTAMENDLQAQNGAGKEHFSRYFRIRGGEYAKIME